MVCRLVKFPFAWQETQESATCLPVSGNLVFEWSKEAGIQPVVE